MIQKITVLTYVVYKFLKLRVKELFVKRGDLDAYIKLDEEYERLDILFDKTFKSRK
jgi:DNA polymerase sigma